MNNVKWRPFLSHSHFGPPTTETPFGKEATARCVRQRIADHALLYDYRRCNCRPVVLHIKRIQIVNRRFKRAFNYFQRRWTVVVGPRWT